MPDYKILIVDYDPRSTEELRGTLEGAGYSVEIAKDGLAGMEAFRHGRPDMAFVEAMLPKKHGFEVCQELKQSPAGENTPIVIITSIYKGRRHRTQAFHQHRCDDYLEKPIAPEKLLSVVKRFLDPERPAPAPVPAPAATTAPPRPSAPAPPVQSESNAELEIMERLDEILPDFGEDVGNIVSFDPSRSRQRQADPLATSPAAVSPRAGASPAVLDPADLIEPVAPTLPPESVAELMQLSETSSEATEGARRPFPWIWIGLGAALVAGIALIFFFLPR